tara:strand:+ start:10861 stop:11025 length:165 start_codon:yes stop_codon:yes gene_type:complete
MICPKCKEKLLWGGEHDSDYDDDAGGIVGNYTCTNEECDVDSVYIYTKFDIDEV